jgi:hypothetical protein
MRGQHVSYIISHRCIKSLEQPSNRHGAEQHAVSLCGLITLRSLDRNDYV